MALQYFSEDRLDDLRHLYCEDKLFRTFSPVLCQLQEKRGELDPVILWHEVGALRERLKRSNHPDTEISFLVGYLRKHLSKQYTERNELESRTEQHIVESMLLILLLLMFQLADAAESPDKLEQNPNHTLCCALAHILTNPDLAWYIEPMRQNLTHKKTDYLGKPIVLPVVDYMKAKVSLDAMDEIAKQEFARIIGHIKELSLHLTTYLNIPEDTYIEIWTNICAETNLFEIMVSKEPRSYDREFNLKMFMNVLGVMQHTKLSNGKPLLIDNVQNVNNAISNKNYRNYLTYYNQFDSNCAYDVDELDQIKRIINDTISKME